MFKKFIKYSIKEYLFCYLSILFLILYWHSAHTLKYDALRYPIIISIIAGVLIVANLVKSVISFRKLYREEQEAAQGETETGSADPWDCRLGFNWKKLGVIGCTLLYLLLLKTVGFLPLSLVYLIGVSYLLGIRNYKALILYAVCITAALYLVFDVWLGIHLPAGILSAFM